MSQFAIFPAMVWERSSVKETAVRAAAICAPLARKDPLEGEARRRRVRRVLPPELEPILAHQGVVQTVLVQAAMDEAEAGFLLSLAERHAFIAGAVVWLDMESPEFERQLAERSAHPRFLGVRPMIQDIEDPEWMRRASVRRAFGALEEQQVCFDFLIK